MTDDNIKEVSEYIYGRNTVLEALKSERLIERVFLIDEDNKIIKTIQYQAIEKSIPVIKTNRHKLDSLCPGQNHQGVVAIAGLKDFCEISDILNYAKEKNESPLIIICDGIEDPANLGAIIRSADLCGAHGIIIAKRGCAPVNATAEKTACGALEYMKVSRVSNISQAIDELKDNGIWVYGASGEAKNEINKTDMRGAMALVIGSEGNGISRLIKEKCDFLISIPMKGHITSYNASNAAAIILYEILRQRNG